MPQTSAHHIAMKASRRENVKDTGRDSDGEKSTLSNVESDDEISLRDDRASRRAGDAPSADSTTDSLELRVKGQDGVNEVVDHNSGQPRTSPRLHIGSTGALPGRGIGDERFLGGRTRRPNNNRTSLRSALTGRFISRRLLNLNSPNTGLTLVATNPARFGRSAGDSENPGIDRVVRQDEGRLSSRHIRCDTCRGWVDDRWYPRCHEISKEVPITGVSAGSQTNADDGE